MNALDGALRRALAEPADFARLTAPGYALRPYQAEAIAAVWRSVREGAGRQFVWVFSRQAGKDEALAMLLAFLLARHRLRGGTIVVAAPTLHPQAALSRDRLLARLTHPLTAPHVERIGGTSVAVGAARARFVSAAPTANVRGLTADLLLVANEAQDIRPEIWDAVFDPMAASTNATTLFLGTVWSRETLLARQMRHLTGAEQDDGARRVFRVPWETVAAAAPAYGERVRARIAQFGPAHPFIRTEYFLEELDGDGTLFPAHRLAQLQGTHLRRHAAAGPGERYALLIDVGGGEEAGSGAAAFTDATRRDSTAVTVVEIGASEAGGDGSSRWLPTYRVVDRLAWTGMSQAALLPRLVDLARNVWRAQAVVIDATGIGAGLASMLAAALGRSSGAAAGPAVRVLPFVFTAASKSALGWDLLGLIESGRLKDYVETAAPGSPEAAVTEAFRAQMAVVTYDTAPGPGRQLRWGAPRGRHDDLVLSLALASALDGMDWRERRAVGR